MAEELELKVMSYNIWNYNEPWAERRKIVVDCILEQDPDVVGLQEIRDDSRFNAPGQNQARQIASRTGLDYHYQPAMIYSRSPRCVEGVCIMSRHPIQSTTCVELTRNPKDEKDVHQRIVLNGTLPLPLGKIEFFVTHFSLSPEMRLSNALELLQFVQSFNSPLPKFVVGDFNCTPNDPPARILTGNQRIPNQPIVGNLIDVWDEAPGPKKPGSNGPGSFGDRRIDYIFMTSSPWARTAVRNVATLNPRNAEGLSGSDHAALTATVSISLEE